MELTEDMVCRSAKQYDPQFVHFGSVPLCRASALGSSLLNCVNLVVLDVSQNQLTSLYGIQHVGATLIVLNAAENQIKNVEDLRECVKLESLFLEGNQLESEAALQPLAFLTTLREVAFKRRVMLEGMEELLDNPFCENEAVYHTVVCQILSRVLWVDDAILRGDERFVKNSSPSPNAAEDVDTQGALRRMANLSTEALASVTPGERAFKSALTVSNVAIEQSSPKRRP